MCDHSTSMGSSFLVILIVLMAVIGAPSGCDILRDEDDGIRFSAPTATVNATSTPSPSPSPSATATPVADYRGFWRGETTFYHSQLGVMKSGFGFTVDGNGLVKGYFTAYAHYSHYPYYTTCQFYVEATHRHGYFSSRSNHHRADGQLYVDGSARGDWGFWSDAGPTTHVRGEGQWHAWKVDANGGRSP